MYVARELEGGYKSYVGSIKSLDELYALHGPGAKRLAYLLTGDAELAQDLVQDAFARILGRFGNLTRPDNFDAYLRQTIVNLARRQWKRRERERRMLEREGAMQLRDAASVVDQDLGQVMWERLMSLPARQRAALVLRFYEDLSESEAAEILGTSVGAARQLVARGVAALRPEIKEVTG